MKKVFLMILAAWVAVGACAQSKLSPALRSAVMRDAAVGKPAGASRNIQAFVSADEAGVAQLRASGVRIASRFGNLVAVEASPEALVRLASLPGVKAVSASSRLHLHCDSARSNTHVNDILAGKGLPMAYDGTGVIVGMVDCGIEYNHPAFKDANGKSRISRVYHPAGSDGGMVVIDGDTLPGCDYATPEQIAKLTTDDKAMSHGCHTTGIAAGSLVGDYGGMAPGAEIVIAGIPNNMLDDYTVGVSARYIAHYAHSVGRPCVINMSLGNHDGPHDGTGILARTIDELAEKYGVIFVLSAGNEAGKGGYMHKVFTAQDHSLSSVMGVSTSNSSEIDVWSRTESPLSITYSIYDSSQDAIVCTGTPIPGDTVINLGNDPVLSEYASGFLYVTQGVDKINGKYRIYVKHAARTTSGRALAFTIDGAEDGEVDVWDVNNNASFSSENLPGFSDGNDLISISDMATGKHTISVGACAARTTYPNAGHYYSTGYSLGSMGRFSSYGTDLNGVVHPFILAPGVQVVSSVSNYNCSKSSYSQRLAVNGTYEYWYVKSGTSMSAPCVTGIVALWLQACPSLNVAQIKEVMASTARPPYAYTPQTGEHGYINAKGGIELILREYNKARGDVNGDGEVDIVDLNVLANIMLGGDDPDRYYGRAHVAGNDDVDVEDINALVNILLQ